jgi:hypothetical protein
LVVPISRLFFSWDKANSTGGDACATFLRPACDFALF